MYLKLKNKQLHWELNNKSERHFYHNLICSAKAGLGLTGPQNLDRVLEWSHCLDSEHTDDQYATLYALKKKKKQKQIHPLEVVNI